MNWYSFEVPVVFNSRDWFVFVNFVVQKCIHGKIHGKLNTISELLYIYYFGKITEKPVLNSYSIWFEHDSVISENNSHKTNVWKILEIVLGVV